MVKQRLVSIMRERNLASLTEARHLLTVHNINRDSKKSEPFTDISEFLPHPDIWNLDTSGIQLSPQAANEFLVAYTYLPFFVQQMFKDDLRIINLVANN